MRVPVWHMPVRCQTHRHGMESIGVPKPIQSVLETDGHESLPNTGMLPCSSFEGGVKLPDNL